MLFGGLTGTVTDTGGIIIGALIGELFKKKLTIKYQDVLYTAIGFVAFGIGIETISQNIPKSNSPILFIISFIVGTIIGTRLGLQDKVDHLSTEDNAEIIQAIVTMLLLSCIGALPIVGSIMAATKNDFTFLFTNASLDFVLSLIFGASVGIRVIVAAPIIFCYQTIIFLLAKWMGDFFSSSLIVEISILGGFMVTASGLNLLNIKQFKTVNMLPSLFIPIIFFALKALFYW
ncbi:DUF554 domain-containing protein [Melissococcus plutonius]|uniref:Transport protein n=1 Tax=Melissococcus plutonius TaxID=33970 RepID=A0A2Z5Y4T2_9ENTE|nr:DUF554 domain-containing protein [Melissococcus plutonius]BAL62864.1 hypothetical protein MPD5_1681 [Melissococcus plutonius DAT561]MCV2498970.1 DUF554 domain-containing protein [Melissococcus plutonius]MCV2501784.1 DUF554 domain-containing protein [Melissococcus plutonius]MCV2505418.1 DUF554 domain-containing protein [Melissococcus plutonius]MCV2507755.1 DUF554 domain-containing protein [Melissococcus plutonius]